MLKQSHLLELRSYRSRLLAEYRQESEDSKKAVAGSKSSPRRLLYEFIETKDRGHWRWCIEPHRHKSGPMVSDICRILDDGEPDDRIIGGMIALVGHKTAGVELAAACSDRRDQITKQILRFVTSMRVGSCWMPQRPGRSTLAEIFDAWDRQMPRGSSGGIWRPEP
jgi:hypothetical protein